MTLLDDLKMSEPEYNSARYDIIRPIQDEVGIYGIEDKRLWDETKERVRDHEWFDDFDGARFGAIITHSDADGVDISRYELETDTNEILRTMAIECFEQDVYNKMMELKEDVQ